MQHQRLIELCNELRLGGIAAQYSALAQKAAEQHTSFTDFIEELLVAEREARELFARVAGFPAIKTLDQYDFNFATGAPRKQIMELASLAFIAYPRLPIGKPLKAGKMRRFTSNVHTNRCTPGTGLT